MGAPSPRPTREDAAELARWLEHDRERALHPADRAAIEATGAVRSLVLDLLASGYGRDLFNACARLGLLLGYAGASPSLAAVTLDGATQALVSTGAELDRTRIPAARAALLEGYVSAVKDLDRSSALARWDPPTCVVTVDPQVAAVACGHPTDDPELLAAWADRVANALVRARIRRVLVGGDPVAGDALREALAMVGIACGGGGEGARVSSVTSTEKPSWFRRIFAPKA